MLHEVQLFIEMLNLLVSLAACKNFSETKICLSISSTDVHILDNPFSLSDLDPDTLINSNAANKPSLTDSGWLDCDTAFSTDFNKVGTSDEACEILLDLKVVNMH